MKIGIMKYLFIALFVCLQILNVKSDNTEFYNNQKMNKYQGIEIEIIL